VELRDDGGLAAHAKTPCHPRDTLSQRLPLPCISSPLSPHLAAVLGAVVQHHEGDAAGWPVPGGGQDTHACA
jgi:hypothetical protein